MAEQFYRQHVFCCTNERPEGHARGSCKARGAEKLRNYLKARAKEAGADNTRINGAGCLDRCELGPVVVVYPEGIWYTVQSEAEADEIIESHLRGGRIVARLLLNNTHTTLTAAQQGSQ